MAAGHYVSMSEVQCLVTLIWSFRYAMRISDRLQGEVEPPQSSEVHVWERQYLRSGNQVPDLEIAVSVAQYTPAVGRLDERGHVYTWLVVYRLLALH